MIRHFPLAQMLSKAFLRPAELPEYDAAQMLLHGIHPLGGTRFAHLRLGLATWQSPGCGALPKGLDAPLLYWVTPWASKFRRPMSLRERVERRLQWRRVASAFRILTRTMHQRKAWVGPPVPGILLQDGQREVFLFTDGNRRIGIAAAIGLTEVPVRVTALSTFTWQRTLKESHGLFSEHDARILWNHCFERVHARG